jgi:hypothetical protein
MGVQFVLKAGMFLQESLQMTPEQRDQILRLRANFLQEQADHQAQWRLLCQCMKQVGLCITHHTFTC